MSFQVQFYLDGAWTTIDPARMGIKPGPIIERHLQEYYWTFFQPTVYDVQVYSYGTPIWIKDGAGDDAATLFRGFISMPDRNGSPGQEGITYRCETWWHLLRFETIKAGVLPRVVYNARTDDPQYDPARVDMTVGEILADLQTLVATALNVHTQKYLKLDWAGFDIPEAPNDLDVVPYKMIFDSSTIPDAIAQLMKWAPDAFLQIDRATGLCTFLRRGVAEVRNLTLDNFDEPDGAKPLSNIKIQPRLDNVVPRIKLQLPQQNEIIEAYLDVTQTTGTPDYIQGLPLTITQIDDLRFQLSHYPLTQSPEVINTGKYNISLSTGMITFQVHPSNFSVRYVAQTGLTTFDTGFGGTGYSDFNITAPIVERFLPDFPILTRRFYCMGVDADDPTWVFSADFAEAFPNSVDWPSMIGKTVTFTDEDGAVRGSSTIVAIQIRNFVFTLDESTVVASLLNLTGSTCNAIGFQLAAAVPDAVRGDILGIVTQDSTAAVEALADALWRALRDYHWAGDLPTLAWRPTLEIGNAVNLLNTRDPKMATMAEIIIELALDPFNQKTQIRLASNPYTSLDDLLGILRQKLPQQNFATGTAPAGGGGGDGKTKPHKHASSSDGGDTLTPKKYAMNGPTPVANQMLIGVNGVKITSTGITVGDPAGNRVEINYGGYINIIVAGKAIQMGNNGGALSMTIDGIEYLFDNAGTKYMGSKIR